MTDETETTAFRIQVMSEPTLRFSTTRAKIIGAMAKAQANLENPTKDMVAKVSGTAKGSGKDYTYTHRYTDIAGVLEEARPVCAAEGIAIIQAPLIRDRHLFLITMLAVEEEWCESIYPVAAIGDSDHQQLGKAMTYAKRVALTAMLGIAPQTPEDNDGQGAAKPGVSAPRSEPQPLRDDLRGTPPPDSRKTASAATRDGDWPLLTKELAEQRTVAELLAWGRARSKLIRAMPKQWFDEMQDLYQDRKAKLQAAETEAPKADGAATGEAQGDDMSPEAREAQRQMDAEFQSRV